ncbi:zonular occludens toxin family protein, partial [Xanthomonas citri pv. citri]|nr:zonular occludens toxin family protein [Xanthomonas citri pv. citri]
MLDTSERSIPWYYPTAILLLIAIIVGAWLTVGRVHDQLTGELHTTPEGSTPKGAAQNGAAATVGA